MLMEGRRAGSSDALLWSLKSLNQGTYFKKVNKIFHCFWLIEKMKVVVRCVIFLEETVLRANSNKIVREHENETAALQEEPVSSQEEELVEYKNVELKRDSFSNVYDKLDELGKGRFGVVFEVKKSDIKLDENTKYCWGQSDKMLFS